VKLFGTLLLSIQLSTCIEPPAMVRYFNYSGNPVEVVEMCKSILDSLQYEIEIYAPESRVIITAPQKVRKDFRRYSYSVVIQVEDLIKVILVSKRHIFKRGSELSLGGKELTEMQVTDKLPYSIQQKIFWPLAVEFNKYGWEEFDPGLNSVTENRLLPSIYN